MPQPDGTSYACARDVTELKAAEEALRQSEENLAVTLESIGDAVLATDAEGRVTRLNAVAERLTGWTRAEAAGRPVAEVFRIINAETRQPAVVPVAETLAREAIHGLANHTVLIARDGTERFIADTCSPIRSRDGRVVGAVLIFRDVTEEVRLNKALRESEASLRQMNENLERLVEERTRQLRESEERFRQLAEQSDEVFWFTELNPERALYVSPAVEKIWGVSAQQISRDARAWMEFIHPEDRPRVLKAFEAAVRGQSPAFQEEYRVVRPDGQTRWVLDSRTAIRDETSQIVRLHGVARDITERKQSEQALRESEEKFRALTASAQDAVIMTDGDDRVVFWNAAAERIFGWTAAEAANQTIHGWLVPARYREAAAGGLARFKVTGQGPLVGKTIELTAVRKDGKEIPIELSFSAVNLRGQWHGIAIARDLTERKKLERQLLRAQRLESIGTLAGGIAHDLNNALAPIMMGVGLLKMRYPKESELVDMFETSAKRGADMVRQLLTFAKGAEGERISVQPGRLLKELEKLMKGSFPKNIQLVVTCDPKLPTVQGDATQLHQVLLNLCVNARDAMPHGGTLTLEAECREVDAVYASTLPDAKPGDYVVLRVRDTGTGIPPEILDRIFDPFFTTKGPDRGTGLGLSTVLGIVKGHGGFLEVHSQPGKGSTFTVYLPVERAGSDTEQVTPAAVEFRGREETILFVDDEAAVREMARVVLRRLNFKPLTATDGADGVIQAAQHRTEIRAIIVDLHMPHMDGLAFVRAVRRMMPDIPIAVASGRLENAVAEEFKTLGVTRRLDKPFTEAQLAETLKHLLAAT